jgi:hypothetical protein
MANELNRAAQIRIAKELVTESLPRASPLPLCGLWIVQYRAVGCSTLGFVQLHHIDVVDSHPRQGSRVSRGTSSPWSTHGECRRCSHSAARSCSPHFVASTNSSRRCDRNRPMYSSLRP